MSLDKFSFGAEFNNESVRVCLLKDQRWIAIIDVISAVTDYKNPYAVLDNLKVSHPQIFEQCNEYKFTGRGQKMCLIAEVETTIRIVLLLPGKKAQKYRKVATDALIQALNPSEAFVQYVTAKLESDLQENSGSVRAPRRPYGHTWLYVRIQLPPEFTKKLSNVLEIDTRLIKFGITGNLNDRNSTYQKDDGDNAFFLFTLQLDSRLEAEVVENVMKLEYSHISVAKSREYLDAVQLAETFGMFYDGTNYEKYVDVAEKLFQKMITITRTLWPGKYDSRSSVYHIDGRGTCQPRLTKKARIDMSSVLGEFQTTRADYFVETGELLNNDTRHYYNLLLDERRAHAGTQQELTRERSEHNATRAALIKLNPELERLEMTDSDVSSSPIDRRSNGKVIARDIITGDETVFDDCEKAANSSKHTISPSALRRSYIDWPRQLKGFHFRTQGQKTWIPPTGYRFDPTYVHKGAPRYVQVKVQANNSSETYVFDSLTAAADLLHLDFDKIKVFLKDKRQYDKNETKYDFVVLPLTDCGTWSDSPESLLPMTSPIVDESGKNGRCNGKIVARDLTTGEETVYDSMSKAKVFAGVHHQVLKSYLNGPWQLRGNHFRTLDAGRYWCPPEYFTYNAEARKQRGNGYVIATDESGNKTMYENVAAAHEIIGVDRTCLENVLLGERFVAGKTWRMALESEYGIFVDIEPGWVATKDTAI